MEGEGTVGVGYQEMRAAQVMDVGEVFPNPIEFSGALPLQLFQAAEVDVVILDLNGRIVWERSCGAMPSGKHQLEFGGELTRGAYAVQVVATTSTGRYVDVRRIARL